MSNLPLPVGIVESLFGILLDMMGLYGLDGSNGIRMSRMQLFKV